MHMYYTYMEFTTNPEVTVSLFEQIRTRRAAILATELPAHIAAGKWNGPKVAYAQDKAEREILGR